MFIGIEKFFVYSDKILSEVDLERRDKYCEDDVMRFYFFLGGNLLFWIERRIIEWVIVFVVDGKSFDFLNGVVLI